MQSFFKPLKLTSPDGKIVFANALVTIWSDEREADIGSTGI